MPFDKFNFSKLSKRGRKKPCKFSKLNIREQILLSPQKSTYKYLRVIKQNCIYPKIYSSINKQDSIFKNINN